MCDVGEVLRLLAVGIVLERLLGLAERLLRGVEIGRRELLRNTVLRAVIRRACVDELLGRNGRRATRRCDCERAEEKRREEASDGLLHGLFSRRDHLPPALTWSTCACAWSTARKRVLLSRVGARSNLGVGGRAREEATRFVVVVAVHFGFRAIELLVRELDVELALRLVVGAGFFGRADRALCRRELVDRRDAFRATDREDREESAHREERGSHSEGLPRRAEARRRLGTSNIAEGRRFFPSIRTVEPPLARAPRKESARRSTRIAGHLWRLTAPLTQSNDGYALPPHTLATGGVPPPHV